MKNIKKNISAVVFAVVLLSSAIFADPGDMGGGGFAAQNDPVTLCDTTSNAEGDMGGGGRSSCEQTESYIHSFLTSLGMYLDSVL